MVAGGVADPGDTEPSTTTRNNNDDENNIDQGQRSELRQHKEWGDEGSSGGAFPSGGRMRPLRGPLDVGPLACVTQPCPQTRGECGAGVFYSTQILCTTVGTSTRTSTVL